MMAGINMLPSRIDFPMPPAPECRVGNCFFHEVHEMVYVWNEETAAWLPFAGAEEKFSKSYVLEVLARVKKGEWTLDQAVLAIEKSAWIERF